MIPPSSPTRTRLVLARMGGTYPVYEVVVDESGGSDDPLNNDPVDSTSLSHKGDILAAMFYSSPNDEEMGQLGEFDENYPRIVVPNDDSVSVSLADDDRIYINDVLYEIDSRSGRPYFDVWRATAVDSNVSDEYGDLP